MTNTTTIAGLAINATLVDDTVETRGLVVPPANRFELCGDVYDVRRYYAADTYGGFSSRGTEVYCVNRDGDGIDMFVGYAHEIGGTLGQVAEAVYRAGVETARAMAECPEGAARFAAIELF